jgi:hypothetical protein
VTGEVHDPLDLAVTKPLPIVEADGELGRAWPDMLFPLSVLYSPGLRLRYRSAFACGCNQVNLACHRFILGVPREAPNKLAIEVENLMEEPPMGTVYVKDAERHSATEGAVQFYQGAKGVLSSAIVRLPESEESPYLTLGVTLHEICHLLGLRHNDDPGSVMYQSSKVRSQLLSDRDVKELTDLYGKNNL